VGLPSLRSERKAVWGENQRSATFLVICLILVYGAYVVHQYKPYTFAVYDPGWYVSTVMSLVQDHDLDLKNQLKGDPFQAADQTAQGKNGEWYPLHEILMPVLTVPFFLVFGINGCLVFNVLISILFMLLVFWLCRRHVDIHSAFTSTVLTAFASFFITFTYSYSGDVFSAFLLVLAYWCAVEHRFLLTGFVWGLAIYSRLANVVTLVGFVVYLFLVGIPTAAVDKTTPIRRILSHRLHPILSYLGGGLPMGLCLLLTNWAMFGSPLITSYDRWQHFVDGSAVISSQRGAFSCSLIKRLPMVLLDPQSGLLLGAPLLLLAIAFGARAFWQRARNEAILQALICISLVALFSKYCNAMPGTLGNRYLMPVVALSAVPLAIAVEECLHRGREAKKQLHESRHS
jgi:hypothetical protein